VPGIGQGVQCFPEDDKVRTPCTDEYMFWLAGKGYAIHPGAIRAPERLWHVA